MFRGFQHSVREIEFLDPVKDHLLMVRLDPRLVQYDAARTERFYQLLMERLRAEPGVRSAALTQNPPLGLGSFASLAFVPEGFVMPRDRESFITPMDTVDEGYFATMGVPLLRGRAFETTDTAEAPRVAIVNERLARHYWPNGDAVGRRIRLDRASGDPVEIVGVAQTIKTGDGPGGSSDFVYLPFAQRPGPRMVLMLRTNGDPLDLVRSVQDSVRILDPNMPILQTMSYAELYRYAVVYGPGVAIKLVGTLGSVALFLAIAGLYGLVAYNVSRRTREIGIRMAIGARPRDVLRLVMGKGLKLAAVGTAIGLAMGFAVERMMNAMIFDAGGTDLLVYAIVVPAMMLVTMLAAWVPARKAARIAPTVALRYE
jgi:putative ABC transport system permease protein